MQKNKNCIINAIIVELISNYYYYLIEMKMNRYYILMADIIGSRKKNSNLMMKDFCKLIAKINIGYQNNFLSPLTITLGDEFQSVVKSLSAGIEIIFAIEEVILEREMDFKLRYVLYFGSIDTKVNRKIAYGMFGAGLTESRHLLEGNKTKRSRFLISTDKNDLSEKLMLALGMLQSILDGWSLKERRIVKEFLLYDDYKKIAKRLKKDVSLLWRRRKSLKIEEFQMIKKLIRLLVEDISCQN
jgi:hypothetical protein